MGNDVLTLLTYETAGDTGLIVFLLLTVMLGGAGAWRIGEAVASGWSPAWRAALAAALLAAAVRFLHYALFAGPLLSLPNYLIDATILIAIALVGWWTKRRRQMLVQYPWLYSGT